MGKPTGFIEFLRETEGELAPLDRIHNWDEFHLPFPDENCANKVRAAWTAVPHSVTLAP
jgi:glutamate synthase (NADPH/NADH) small chain